MPTSVQREYARVAPPALANDRGFDSRCSLTGRRPATVPTRLQLNQMCRNGWERVGDVAGGDLLEAERPDAGPGEPPVPEGPEILPCQPVSLHAGHLVDVDDAAAVSGSSGSPRIVSGSAASTSRGARTGTGRG
jgi:hypothetical protein